MSAFRRTPLASTVALTGVLRTAASDGSFADARTMSPDQVEAFPVTWKAAGS